MAGVLALATAAAPAPPDARAEMGKYLDLITRYRDGDTEAAIQTIAAWDQKDLGRVVFALTSSAKRPGSPFTNGVLARLPAAIMLHTEAGLSLDWQGGDPWPQWQIARWVAAIEPRSDAHREFLRAWYLAFGLHCLATYRLADALVELERGHARFPDDVEIALALAQAHEARGTASMRPALVAPPDSEAGRDLRAAAGLFTDVLRQQPTLGRARVRLGRVTSLLGEEDAALTEFARAATQGDERVAYLSHLFAGEILRRRSRLPDARAEFERARDAMPRGQVAALGLAETLHSLGDFERAAEALDPGIAEPVLADPARTYWSGDREEDKARLEALKRSIVRITLR